MAKVICGVYKITNLVNGKFYIGSSKNIKARWYQHKSQLNDNQHRNIHLQNAWNLYGSQNFQFEIIEKCELEKQFEREQYYLDKLNPFDDNGYNIVRQIAKEYSSDNYITKTCKMCSKEYHTFSHLSKYCDRCKELIAESTKDWWKTWVNEKIKYEDILSWGYDSWDDFYESNI
jgi:predicted GIY-YIG superfamily endonuclease